jgi:hypothetical protein
MIFYPHNPAVLNSFALTHAKQTAFHTFGISAFLAASISFLALAKSNTGLEGGWHANKLAATTIKDNSFFILGVLID